MIAWDNHVYDCEIGNRTVQHATYRVHDRMRARWQMEMSKISVKGLANN